MNGMESLGLGMEKGWRHPLTSQARLFMTLLCDVFLIAPAIHEWWPEISCCKIAAISCMGRKTDLQSLKPPILNPEPDP